MGTNQRGYGEGSIYKRADGRWCAQATLPDASRKYIYGKTRAEVARKLTALQYDLTRGITPGDGRQTVQTWLETWLEMIKPPRLDPSTWQRYSEQVRLHITPALGAVKLVQLQPQQLQQMYADLQREKGLSSTTVHHIHEALHSSLEMAMNFDLVGRNVADRVNAPRILKKEIHPLTAEEARAYLAATTGHRVEALFTLALATGMRQGELLALHWRDVDLGDTAAPARGGRLSVTSNLYVEKGAAIFKAPKTKYSRRQVAFAPYVTASLRAHRLRQHAERQKAGVVWQDHDLVFCRRDGSPFSPRVAYWHHQQFLRVAGIMRVPLIRFHDLRHTCATLLLMQNVNPKMVSEMLGHSSVRVTLDIYAHVLPNMQQDAAAAMAKLMGWEDEQPNN
jgi:integrase